MTTKARKLKVSEYDHHPRLLLAGKWLDRAGFKPGDTIIITNPEPGQLVIQVETPAKAAADTDEVLSVLPLSMVAEPEPKFYRSFLFPAA